MKLIQAEQGRGRVQTHLGEGGKKVEAELALGKVVLVDELEAAGQGMGGRVRERERE